MPTKSRRECRWHLVGAGMRKSRLSDGSPQWPRGSWSASRRHAAPPRRAADLAAIVQEAVLVGGVPLAPNDLEVTLLTERLGLGLSAHVGAEVETAGGRRGAHFYSGVPALDVVG